MKAHGWGWNMAYDQGWQEVKVYNEDWQVIMHY